MLLGLSFLTLSESSAAPVQRPELLTQLKWTGTSWFGSPIIHDLGGGGKKLIGTFYDVFVWDHQFSTATGASKLSPRRPRPQAALKSSSLILTVLCISRRACPIMPGRATTRQPDPETMRMPTDRGTTGTAASGSMWALEIVVQTFGVGCFIFTVPDSA